MTPAIEVASRVAALSRSAQLWASWIVRLMGRLPLPAHVRV